MIRAFPAAVLAIAFAIMHPREAVFVFAAAYALGLIGCDLWRARHKIAAAIRVE